MIKIKELKIGKITHYYDKIGVAVVALENTLLLEDEITIVNNHNKFKQIVRSMQLEHKQLTSAKKGQSIGLKVDQPVKTGSLVLKVKS